MKTIYDFEEDYILFTVAKIGEGGNGSVYLCTRRLSLDADLYAVKLTPMAEPSNEIQLWKDLEHPNIVSLIDYFLDAETKTMYLVMEYSPDFLDLFKFIQEQQNSLPQEERSRIIRQLIDLVSYLTDCGVDHRDIKDENLLYNPETGQIKLIDFGSSTALSQNPYTEARGTVTYLPPEFYLTGSYSSKPATVWAIGCLSYILYKRDRPFNSTQEILRGLHLRTSTCEESFIYSCLHPDPDERLTLLEVMCHPWLLY